MRREESVRNYRLEYMNALDGSRRLTEKEALAIILGNAFGGKDMNLCAENILARFPSVRAATEATLAELTAVDGVTESVALYLKALERVFAIGKEPPTTMTSANDCINFMLKRLSKTDNEHFEFYCVDGSGKVVEIKSYTSEKVDKVEVAAREIMGVVATAGASGIYVGHNHVNASVSPSEADDKTTLKVLVACRMCGLKFYDHCIVNSSGQSFSYRKSGRLEKLEKNLQ